MQNIFFNCMESTTFTHSFYRYILPKACLKKTFAAYQEAEAVIGHRITRDTLHKFTWNTKVKCNSILSKGRVASNAGATDDTNLTRSNSNCLLRNFNWWQAVNSAWRKISTDRGRRTELARRECLDRERWRFFCHGYPLVVLTYVLMQSTIINVSWSCLLK